MQSARAASTFHGGGLLRLMFSLSLLPACVQEEVTQRVEDSSVRDQRLPEESDRERSRVRDRAPSEDVAVQDQHAPEVDHSRMDHSVLDLGIDQGGAVDFAYAPCDPPLSLSSTPRAVLPYGGAQLSASGGEGLYRFRFLEQQSGGLLNGETGAYIAGDIAGVIDVIEVTDRTCIGQATLELPVVTSLQPLPSGGEVERGQRFNFESNGGSGRVSFQLLSSTAGSVISEDGLYEAGASTGIDLIEALDLETEERIEVTLQVIERVTLRAESEQIFLPLGSRVELSIDGGTGVYDLEGGAASLDIEGVTLRAVEAGEGILAVRDHFTGHQTDLPFTVIESLSLELDPFNDLQISTRFLSAGDLNGDGGAELLIGESSADIEHGNSGAVFLFESGVEGLSLTPAQVLSGASIDEGFGRDLAVGDLNGDGYADLAVGARLADLPRLEPRNDSGGVYLFNGRLDGRFEENPSTVLPGLRSGDHLGTSLTICDFNGDGRLDIAAGSPYYKDRTRDSIVYSEGGISIFLGDADGFSDAPDQILTGGVIADANTGSLTPTRDLLVGQELTAADFDGDGACELVIGVSRYRIGRVNNSGAVFIYRGIRGEGEAVESAPARVILGDGAAENGGSLGRRLAVGDLSGDGHSELVIGEHVGDIGGRDRGAVYVFLGDRLLSGERARVISVTEAEGFYPGDSNYDNDGIGFTIGDVTGDALADLIVGAYVDDPPGRSNAGRISIYPGVVGAAPLAEQLREIDGPLTDMRLGEALAVVADSDGDGVNDIAAHAQRDSSEFHHGGRSYLITRGLDEVEGATDLFTPLEIPRQVAAGRFGEGVAFIGDLNRDGHSEYVATASHVTTSAGRSGGAWLFSGDAGRAGEPGLPLNEFPNHTGYDLLWGASAAGDFNGDGLPDFALLLRDDERPTNSQLVQTPWREVVEGACGPRGYNTGGVYVFLGQPGGQFPTRPSLAFWGADAGSSPESLVGPLDFNGDGYSDLLLGSFRSDPGGRNNAGKSLIIGGRSRLGSGDEIDVICTPYATYEGPTNGMELGRSVAPLGDINGDGCDDYAVGSRLEDRPSLNDEGGVRIIYGFGGPGCLSQPHAHRLVSGERNSQAGWSLAVGDGDGDGRPELAIGAWQSRNENVPVGRVWVIPGDALSALTPRPVRDAERATPTLLSQWGESWTIQGKQRDAHFSYRLAFAGGLLAVSAPQAALADQARVGTVSLYRITASGIVSHPAALVFGESERPHGRLGFSLAGRESAMHTQLLIGAPWGSGTGLDNGSVYQLIFAAE